MSRRTSYQAPRVMDPSKTALIPVKSSSSRSMKVISVCLYAEPTYAARFPSRNFESRYIASCLNSMEFLAREDYRLVIFTDHSMLRVAGGIDADVYLVTSRPRYPFEQNLWRYYAASALRGSGVNVIHFRGMDNIAAPDDRLDVMRDFEASGFDLLNAPYLRARGLSYCPVRGSCSVGGNGIESLASWMDANMTASEILDWPACWHQDENVLSNWFDANWGKLRIYTMIDRVMPIEFYTWMDSALRAGVSLKVSSISKKGWLYAPKPM